MLKDVPFLIGTFNSCVSMIASLKKIPVPGPYILVTSSWMQSIYLILFKFSYVKSSLVLKTSSIYFLNLLYTSGVSTM